LVINGIKTLKGALGENDVFNTCFVLIASDVEWDEKIAAV
jgi:hypothetical protein